MYNLAKATQVAQSDAAAKGRAIYVIELENDEREEGWSDLTSPSPAMLAEIQAIREEEERLRQLWKDDPDACRAAGMLPPWNDVPVPFEEQRDKNDYSDSADPVTFEAMDVIFVAIHLLDNFFVPLLRVAMPDGTVVAITDQEDEEANILAEYGVEAQRQLAKIREQEIARDERASE